jgi:hypothetical protein
MKTVRRVSLTRLIRFVTLSFVLVFILPGYLTPVRAGTVNGPASSTVGNFPCWNNTTGTLLSDCSVGNAPNSNEVNWSANNYFGSGRPWCDVVEKGAVGDGTTDDSAAFAACITTINGMGGGTVYIPPSPNSSSYCVFSGVATNSSYATTLLGASQSSVVISSCHHNVATIDLQGSYSQIINLEVLGYGAYAADNVASSPPTQPAILLGTNCVGCVVDHVSTFGGLNGIRIFGGSDCIIRDTYTTNAYGTANIYVAASSSSSLAGCWFKRTKIDQSAGTGVSPPGSPGGATVGNWAGGANYVLNQVVLLPSGYFVQCSQAGTSGGTAPTIKPYNVTITDGSVNWLLYSPSPYYGLQLDSGSNQNFVEQADIDGTYTAAVGLTNTLAYTQAPTLTTITSSNIGAALSYNVAGYAGEGLSIQNSTIGNCLGTNCVGLYFASNWQSSVRLVGNLIYGGGYGIDYGGGYSLPVRTNLIIENNEFYGWNQTVFLMSPNLGYFIFQGNICGSSQYYGGSNGQCYNVVTGTSNFYVITNNIMSGQQNASVDSGSGANKNVTNNF